MWILKSCSKRLFLTLVLKAVDCEGCVMSIMNGATRARREQLENLLQSLCKNLYYKMLTYFSLDTK